MTREYEKIPEAIKKVWVDALLSGKYEQGQNYLKQESGKDFAFCCLGVLAETQNVVNTPSHCRNQTFEYNFDSCGFLDRFSYEVPPDGFCGLSNETINELTEKNDSGETFEYIAEWIKENL